LLDVALAARTRHLPVWKVDLTGEEEQMAYAGTLQITNPVNNQTVPSGPLEVFGF
jgi:hypothetical protein